MKTRHVWLALLAVLVFQGSAFAGSGSKVFDAYKAHEKKMESAMKSLILTQEMDGHGMVAEITVYKKGRKLRMENVIKKSANPMMGKPGQKTIVIDDGQTLWTFSPMMGKMENPSEADEEDQKPLKVVEKGRETVSGQGCVKIDVSYPGEQQTLWISTKDHVLVKEDVRDGYDRVVTQYSEFKSVKGFPLAHKIETYEGGNLVSTVRMTSVKPNARIDDALFDAKRVKGYEKTGAPAMGHGAPAMPGGDGNDPMNMMQMALEIQRLYQNGEVEKAQALEKKMQKMMQ